MPRNIVLDWHGVIDNISPMRLRKDFFFLTLNMLKKFKFKKAWHIVRFSFDSYSTEIDNYAAGLISPDKFWDYIQEHSDLDIKNNLQRLLSKVELNSQLISLLKSRQQDFKFYILSDCPQDKAAFILKALPAIKFQDIFLSYRYKTTKRRGGLFDVFLEKTQLQPSDCLFIDDSRKNIQIAKQKGFQAFNFRSNKDLPALKQLLNLFKSK